MSCQKRSVDLLKVMNRIWYFEDSSLFTQLVKCFLMSISKAACCDTLPHATRTALGLKSPVAPGRVEHVARWQVQGGLRGWRCLTYRIPSGRCPPMFLFTEEFSHAEGWSHSRYIICEKNPRHPSTRMNWAGWHQMIVFCFFIFVVLPIFQSQSNLCS